MESLFLKSYEDRYVTINGNRVRYWDTGAGEPILLIHGLGGSIEQWLANIDALSASHRVICCDMPGCGKSDPLPNADYTLEALSQHLDMFVCKLQCNTLLLIGLSLGGAMCLRYTIDHPEKVRKLVLVSSAGLGPRMAHVFTFLTLPGIDCIPGLLTRRQFAYYVRSMVYDPSVISEDILDFYYKIIKTPAMRHAFLKTLKDNCSLLGLKKHVREGVIQKLNTLELQTLIIWGNQDNHMPLANVHDAMKVLPHAKLVFFDKCRHNPQFEKIEEFNSTVSDFLKD
jgi:pimeloyl-ACP methyl ester carboxylesterase